MEKNKKETKEVKEMKNTNKVKEVKNTPKIENVKNDEKEVVVIKVKLTTLIALISILVFTITILGTLVVQHTMLKEINNKQRFLKDIITLENNYRY